MQMRILNPQAGAVLLLPGPLAQAPVHLRDSTAQVLPHTDDAGGAEEKPFLQPSSGCYTCGRAQGQCACPWPSLAWLLLAETPSQGQGARAPCAATYEDVGSASVGPKQQGCGGTQSSPETPTAPDPSTRAASWAQRVRRGLSLDMIRGESPGRLWRGSGGSLVVVGGLALRQLSPQLSHGSGRTLGHRQPAPGPQPGGRLADPQPKDLP